MSSKIIAMGLCGALLVGCGGASEIKQPSLSDYEGRNVSTETLAGTWVVFGAGNIEQTFTNETFNSTFQAKEFFVIRPIGDTGSYEKSTCYGDGFLEIGIDGSTVDLEFAQGTIQNNILIQASRSVHVSPEDESFDEKTGVIDGEIAYSMIKISDSVEKIGNATKTLTNTEEVAFDVFCFNQSSREMLYDGSVIEYNSLSAAFSTMYSSSFLFSTKTYKGLDQSKSDILLDDGEQFYEDSDDAVMYSLNDQDSLNISMSYSASNNVVSVVGSVMIQLPAL